MSQPAPDSAARTIEWTYRVAQNPRWLLAFAALCWYAGQVIWAATSIDVWWFLGVIDPVRAAYSERPDLVELAYLGSSAMVAVLVPTVTGFVHLRTPPRIDEPRTPIPAYGHWRLHIPFVVGIALGSWMLIRWFSDPDYDNLWSQVSAYVALAIGWAGIALVGWSLVAGGHRRALVFTPGALHYTRGYFQAAIPWDSVTALRSVCDANIKNGGPGEIHRPSHRNLRAGVQMFVREGVETRRKTMLFRIDDQDVIGVDCSGYKIEPNTLINAIYLLVENPGLRPLLDTPGCAEFFVGPDWNTRRTMRVGDRWDRSTGEIVRADDKDTP